MLVKTRGIVLGYIKFKEHSIIVKIFTEKLGVKSYIVNNVRSSKKTKFTISLFQPLAILELLVYNKEHIELNRISEAKFFYLYQSIQLDYKKSSVLFFLAEFFQKIVKTEKIDQELFQFMLRSLLHFDKKPFNQSFHIELMFYIAEYFGFKITGIQNFEEINICTAHLTKNQVVTIEGLLKKDNKQLQLLSRESRNELLDILIQFYQYHFDNFAEMKSIKILKALFST